MSWFEELTVTKRLAVAFLFLSIIFIVEGYMGLRNVNRISGNIDSIYNDNLVPLNEVVRLRKLVIRDYRLKVFQHIGTSDVKGMDALKKELEQVSADIDAGLKNEEIYKLKDKESEYLKAIIVDWNGLNESYKKILALSEGFSKEDAFKVMVAENQKLADAVDKDIAMLYASKEKSVTASYEDSRKVKKRSWMMMAGITVIAILALFGVSLLITGSVTRYINGAVNTISSTSTEISATVEQHERTASQQAASVNETTTTIEELGAASRQSAEQTDSVAAMAKGALATTEEGVKMARQASEGMVKMKEKVEGIGEQILHLSEQTGQIGKIATAVTDIAGQINMLALNAAVEAVRAGEQGKGFAVIAQEVRKLADQGKKSAEQANTIVADIQKATNSAVMVTEEGTKTVQEVAEIATKAGASFASISGVASSVYENAKQVSLNSKQQVGAIKQVVEAMNNINAGAKETAAGISQTKVGIQRLNEAAQNLKKMV